MGQATDGRKSDDVLRRFELKSGVIGIRWRASLRRLSRTFVPAMLFALNAKWLTVVDRPQDIDDEDAMSFFGGDEGDADLSQG